MGTCAAGGPSRSPAALPGVYPLCFDYGTILRAVVPISVTAFEPCNRHPQLIAYFRAVQNFDSSPCPRIDSQ